MPFSDKHKENQKKSNQMIGVMISAEFFCDVLYSVKIDHRHLWGSIKKRARLAKPDWRGVVKAGLGAHHALSEGVPNHVHHQPARNPRSRGPARDCRDLRRLE
jgi:hypothetical protein